MPSPRDFFLATRPWSFSMSVLSVALGTAVAAADGPIAWGWLLLTLVGAVLIHAAGNVLNDHFDSTNGVDQPDSPTAQYRPHPILGGLLSPRALLIEGLVLLGLATAIGLTLAYFRSAHVLWLALAGLGLTLAYTAKPLVLKYRALGEVAVFLIWGPLMVEGAYAVQRDALSLDSLVVSIPFGALVALVLLANNLRDIDHDARTGIRTLGTTLGREQGLRLFRALMLSAYAYTGVAVVFGVLSPWVLAVFLSLPMAFELLGRLRAEMPAMADAMTAKLDTVFGVLFLGGIFAAQIVPWP
ncbi:MAG: prenyltransferase [Chromatiaceae bacterium]|jgi:1,4-dihydroxy-2-naphthoate octaprenyltransferase|nr:prenyltransferase [Chromatiaceae bacterium]